MTRDAGNSIIIKGPLHVRVFGQRTGKQSGRVMTRFAVTRELDSLLGLNVLNIFLIEGFAKSVTVRRLAPLSVRICVTSATAPGRHKHLAGNKCARGGAGIAWS